MTADAPRVRFAHLPTPLEEMPRLRAALGPHCPRLLVKRDDATGLGLGGNKTRKLEFLMGAAQAAGAGAVLTYGALQSNHARQTAAAAAKLGLTCDLILFDMVAGRDPVYRVTGNPMLDRLFGARVHVVNAGDDFGAIRARVMAAHESEGRRVYDVPTGGSNATGALGYASAYAATTVSAFVQRAVDALTHFATWGRDEVAEHPAEFAVLLDLNPELLGQLDAMDIRARAIVHASSSGGTQAGLVAGRLKAGRGPGVIGINVAAADAGAMRASVLALARETAARIGAPAPDVDDIDVRDGFLGAGYGQPTDAMREAVMLLAQMEGLLLDPVYSGKAMAALLHLVRAGTFAPDETVIFLHTGGAPALFAYPEIGTATK